MPSLVSRKAPSFEAPAVLGNGQLGKINFHEQIAGKYALVFFYPLDFTFVCPTELVELNRSLAEFKSRNIEVFGVSIDSHYSHLAWRNTSTDKGGIGEVGYPLIADIDHSIARAFGVEHPQAGVALRAAILIDKEGVVRAELINDLPLGRNISEILRLFDALQFHEQHGEVCPANWSKGKPGMKATPEESKHYFETHYQD